MSGNRSKVTKELALVITPFLAAYLFIVFYEAGFSNFFGFPYSLIEINVVDVILTNRFALIVATLAFLWTGLYYNFLPSANSPIFKGFITAVLILSLWAGYAVGYSDAKTKEEFLTTQINNQKFIVVRIYEDTSIMMPLKSGTRTLLPEYHFEEISASENTSIYKLEKIGPLVGPLH